VHNFLLKTEGCAKTLAQWNSETFGHIGQEIKALERKLKS